MPHVVRPPTWVETNNVMPSIHPENLDEEWDLSLYCVAPANQWSSGGRWFDMSPIRYLKIQSVYKSYMPHVVRPPMWVETNNVMPSIHPENPDE